jgi:predicted HTH transcriptional regulator
LTENSVKNAAKERASRVTLEHCKEVIQKETEEITLELQEKHIHILKFLAKTDYVSPSEAKFQKSLSLSRSYLRTLLEDLVNKGYIRKEKRGKKSLYTISSQYRPYFAKETPD